ncbi:MAG: hypothetical protein CML67_13535 [Rhodobacteraceae bacterium]|nr:hypothetical protein [Paracoccaceae bacterium]
MDISKAEQRVLHLLAQGGRVLVEKDERNRIIHATCVTREGWHSPGLDLALFRKLRRRGYIASSGGAPYRITRLGTRRVRSQPDNR